MLAVVFDCLSVGRPFKMCLYEFVQSSLTGNLKVRFSSSFSILLRIVPVLESSLKSGNSTFIVTNIWT